MGEIIAEILGEVLSEVLGSRKVPKIIRYILLALVIGFLEFVFIAVAINSDMLIGSIICVILAVAMLVLGVYIAIFRIN